MTGLLKKDFYMLWSQSRMVMILSVFYTIIGVVANNGFMITFAVVFMSILPLTAMGIDEKCKWDVYAVMLPYSRFQLVFSRYLMGIIGVGFIVLFSLLGEFVWKLGSGGEMDFKKTIEFAATSFVMAAVFLGFNLPVMFKVGVEKGRLANILGIAILAVLIKFFDVLKTSEAGLLKVAEFLSSKSDGIFIIRNLSFVGGGLLVILLSAWISVIIYRKKEF